MAEILQRLKQRKLVQWALAYVAFAFALLQGVDILAHQFGWPGGLQRGLTLALTVGLVMVLVLAWYHGERGMQRVSGAELLILALLLAIGGGLLWRFAPVSSPGVPVVAQPNPELVAPDSGARAAASGPRTATAPPMTVPAKSIAVLPLANGGGEGQQFFSDGLSEALIIALSQFDGLKVIGRNSSFQFRDTRDASAVIGRKLGVAHLLEGSVQHAGNTVRVSIELIDADSGQTRWSQHYDRPYKDLFKLQDEITNAVAGAMHAELLSPNEARLQSDRPPSGNIEAYNAYLQGLKYWHNEDFRNAAEYMTRAVQLDPGYAMAWALLSGSWSTVAMFQNDPPAEASEHMRIARAAADKALQLAPELGPAEAARTYLKIYHFDHQGALTGCRRAVQLAPKDGTVLNGCGYVLAQVGKPGEAIPLRARLLSTEPLYTINYLLYARLLMATGRLDEAEKYLRTADSLPLPNSYWRSSIIFSRTVDAMMRGDARAAMGIVAEMPAEDRVLFTALAAQAGSDRTAADAALANALASKHKADAEPYLVAQIYALRGDASHAIEWLQRASSGDLVFLPTDPLILNLRDDPRFIAFCRKIGLPPPGEVETLSFDQIRAAQTGKG